MLLATILAVVAAAVTGPATNVTASTATLNGTVDDATTAYFEWGTTAGYGERTASKAPTNGAVSDLLAGLTPDTTYHYRIVPEGGTDTPGADATFVTGGPPTVSNQASSGVTPTEATVTASVNTKGLRTAHRVQWGTTTGYGNSTPIVYTDTGTATPTVTLTGLRPNTTYHWRTRASNAAGTALGADRRFKTGPLPTAVSVALSSSIVPWGNGLTLGGRVSGAGVSGLTVALEHQRFPLDLGFSEAASARTGRDGGYLFTIANLWSTTRYRVVTRTQVVAASPEVTARSAVRVNARARHVRRKRARVEGTIQPAVHGTASLQRRLPGGWRQVGIATVAPTDANRSRFGFAVARIRRAAKRFRVVVSPVRGAHVRGRSRAVVVRARPRRG